MKRETPENTENISSIRVDDDTIVSISDIKDVYMKEFNSRHEQIDNACDLMIVYFPPAFYINYGRKSLKIVVAIVIGAISSVIGTIAYTWFGGV